MTESDRAWFRRHPLAALLGLNVGLFLALGLLAEVVLRIAIPYNPGYYVAVEGDSRELVYPYGTIYINSAGFADEEFDLEREDRVGYFGDSVTYGTGAGYGHRISEHLEAAYPAYEHMNFGGIDLSANARSLDNFVDIARRFELDKAIYLFNLNDILPAVAVSGQKKTTVGNVRTWVQRNLDWLRGQSYVYTWLRNLVKTLLVSRGTGWLGYPTYELFPSRHEAVVLETAQRINRFSERLADEGVELIVVLLPYEMQISEEAAEVYASKGVEWEPDFVEGATQRMVADRLDPSIPRYDALQAFVAPGREEGMRRSHRVGEYYVYDKGDKLDWNHPNRAGHRRISDHLIAQEILGPPIDRPLAHSDPSAEP